MFLVEILDFVSFYLIHTHRVLADVLQKSRYYQTKKFTFLKGFLVSAILNRFENNTVSVERRI